MDASGDVRSILVRQTGRAFGDQIFVTPALRALCKEFPQAAIDVMCRAEGRLILRHNPQIRRFITPYVPGKVYPECAREYDRFYCCYRHVWRRKQPWSVRNVYQQVCQSFGLPIDDLKPEYHDTDGERRRALTLMRRHALEPGTSRPLVLLHPSGSSPARRVSGSFVGALVKRLLDDGMQVGMLGLEMPPELIESGLAERVAFPFDCGIRNQFAMLRFADALVAVDSCFSHVACALDTPSVVLYGPTDAALYTGIFPNVLAIQGDVPCGPCTLHAASCVRFPESPPPCMQSFDPDYVFSCVQRVLSGDWRRTYAPPQAPPESAGPSACPFCRSRSRWLAVRIKSVYYYRCRACESLYAVGPRAADAGATGGRPRAVSHRAVSSGEALDASVPSPLLTQQSHTGLEKPTRISPEVAAILARALDRLAREFNVPKRLVEVHPDGDGIGEHLRSGGWSRPACHCSVSGVGAGDTSPARLAQQWHTGVEKPMQQGRTSTAQLESTTDQAKAGVLLFIHSFELLSNPVIELRRLVTRLECGGLVVILSFVPPRAWALWPAGWLPVYTPVAGTNRVFASRAGIRRLARRLGLELVVEDRWPDTECVFWVLRNPK